MAISFRSKTCELLKEHFINNKNAICLGSDGYSVFEDIVNEMPKRYIDVGIAEANLVGVASGLARTDYEVWGSCISAFLLRRAYEQIKVDICDPGLNVKLIGTGGGLSYGQLGSTHYMCEDIALLRNLPNIEIYIPYDELSLENTIKSITQNNKNPAYVRLSGVPENNLPRNEKIRNEHNLESGCDLILKGDVPSYVITCGVCTQEAYNAIIKMKEGTRPSLLSMWGFHQYSEEILLKYCLDAEYVLVAEEHGRYGGLGSLVSSLFLEHGVALQNYKHLYIPSIYPHPFSREELLKEFGLDSLSIYKTILVMQQRFHIEDLTCNKGNLTS